MQAELEHQQGEQYELLSLEALHPELPEGHTTIYAMKATSDPDTMYFHEAMREPDKAEFLKAARKELDAQLNDGVIELIERKAVPKGATLLPAV